MSFLWLLIFACGTPSPEAPVTVDEANPTAAVEKAADKSEHDCLNADPDHECDCGGHGAAAAPADEDAAEENSDGAVWSCPMHAEVTATEAGACPECGMDLTNE